MTETRTAKAYCSHCKVETNHISIQNPYKRQTEYGDEIQWEEFYYVARCMGCDTIAFIREYGDEDMWNESPYIDGERDYYTTITVYPEKPKEDPTLKDPILVIPALQLSPKEFEKLPEDILELYNQIIHVYNLKYYLLCAFGLRTLIEAICKEVGVTDGTLFDENKQAILKKDGLTKCKSQSLEGKIYGLYENDYILWRHALILQKVRDVGNSAAHEIKTPTKKTVKDSIGIIEKVLEDIYDLDKYQIIPNN
ncbi:DUF4145 domain-containing protein [Paenibacillus sp. CH40]|uniref:DUF4145 domain-containing protein n=1 Tax=Paenibacillus sp. CH40 TaxID=2962045 RepID=UPI0020B74658|nr:DUF4145 domain-containing protein [Paenibacillus sp. CH40]MCP3793067.1 DUF4145 domain-containing protein [Paenibacillus sp. CH40]